MAEYTQRFDWQAQKRDKRHGKESHDFLRDGRSSFKLFTIMKEYPKIRSPRSVDHNQEQITATEIHARMLLCHEISSQTIDTPFQPTLVIKTPPLHKASFPLPNRKSLNRSFPYPIPRILAVYQGSISSICHIELYLSKFTKKKDQYPPLQPLQTLTFSHCNLLPNLKEPTRPSFSQRLESSLNT